MPEQTPDVERELAALDDALAGRRVAPDLTELGELALALREERPRPADSFGTELDAKVARGFGEPGPRRASGRRWWHALFSAPVLGTATAVLLVVAVVVAAPGGDDEEASTGGPIPASSDSGGGSASSTAQETAPQSARSSGDDAATFSEPLPPGSVPPAPGAGSPG